jgi:hypothetical protein
VSPKLSAKEIEELLKIAELDVPEEVFQEYSDVEDFIVSLGIKEGRDKVMWWKVYEAYEKWSDGKPKLNPRAFAVFFRKNFRQLRESGDGGYYRLDGKPFDLRPDDLLNRIAAENRKRREQLLYEKRRKNGLKNYAKIKPFNDERRKAKKEKLRKARAARRFETECPPEE